MGRLRILNLSYCLITVPLLQRRAQPRTLWMLITPMTTSDHAEKQVTYDFTIHPACHIMFYHVSLPERAFFDFSLFGFLWQPSLISFG